ncbi:hypothetical protein CDAR_444421 [Caerostris darwini]|uniref:Uncharacterized protein n=1 Tax=Caerostris darwini TaxID=1538125 RepID=A0AAV4X9C9_9ARAC|nr:hypothetical protein CDAR_444421 [Caerostris darwini]
MTATTAWRERTTNSHTKNRKKKRVLPCARKGRLRKHRFVRARAAPVSAPSAHASPGDLVWQLRTGSSVPLFALRLLSPRKKRWV